MARKRRKRKKLTPEQKKTRKIQRDQKKDIRSIFGAVGFNRIASASDKEANFRDTVCDFDDIFLFENLVVLTEYTISQESNVSDHLKGKRKLFEEILEHPREFIEFLTSTYPQFRAERHRDFPSSRMKVAIAYCSRYGVATKLKRDYPSLKFLDYQIAKYFKAVMGAIRESGRFELLHFLGFSQADVGRSALSPGTSVVEGYGGSILPEEASHFPPGYKVVSFYVDPAALLARSYVLRQDRWEEKGSLYQRMIVKKKIEAIRKYLLDDERVFVNNIIVTLPSSTELRTPEDRPLDVSKVNRTRPVMIRLPAEFNSIGLVDGQHRVYSYYEGGNNEDQIGRLRRQQNLLATGIIYPKDISPAERIKFEATLFLEINANQTNAKSDVKQAIGLLLHPFSAESIAKQVVNKLNDEGPLEDQFERYFFDKGKIKTTSVVSYGIRPIVNIGREGSLFETWDHPRKSRLAKHGDTKLLGEYIDYCVTQINHFLGAVRASLPRERWNPDKRGNGLLTTTVVNGFIVCLRKIIEHKGVHKFEYYRSKLSDLSSFDFAKYKSSQYGSMGTDLHEAYFSTRRQRDG